MATLEDLQAQLNRIEHAAIIGAKKVLTITEASWYTGYSVQYLYKLTSRREIPYSKKGNKVHFDKEELEDWMLQGRVPTTQNFETMAEDYCLLHPRI